MGHASAVSLRVALDAHMVGEQETGNETYLVNLIRGLAEVDTATSYLLYSPHPAALRACGPLPANFAIRRVWPSPAPLRIPVGLPARTVRDQADVLHVTYIAPPVIPAAVVATVHDISFALFPEAFSPRDRWILSTLVPRTLRRAEAVITVSEHSRREIVRQYSTPEDKITVVYQPVSPAFRPIEPSAVDAVSARFGFARAYILAVGNLQPRKNLSRLLHAYAMLRQQGAYTGQLVLVGKSKWQGSHLVDLVRRLGLQREVVFTGYVAEDELAALYNGADVFVYPSLYEGFGLPPLEAMACGCPVVASDSSSLPEVIGDAGMTVDPLSTSALAAAIERLLCDDALRQALVGRGLARAEQFSAASFAAATQAVYERAARPTRHSRGMSPVSVAGRGS